MTARNWQKAASIGRQGADSVGRLNAGDVAGYRGQQYEFIRRQPHLKADGSHTEILAWRSTCLQCRQQFECTTALKSPTFKPLRRCAKCRAATPWTPRLRTELENAHVTWPRREFAPIEAYEDLRR